MIEEAERMDLAETVFGEGQNIAVIGICTLTAINNKCYATHLQFAFKLAKENPDYQFVLFTPYRTSIDNFRNTTVKAALELEAKYVMFIDDDSVLEGAASMFKHLKDKIDEDENKHIIMPIVYVRGYPFKPMFFKWVEDEGIAGKGLDHYDDFREQETDEEGLLEVAAIGCSTCLIKTEVFNALPKPYFSTGPTYTEDVFFCVKCHDYIENIGIYLDTTICSGHLLDPLYVNEQNVDSFREFYKNLGLNTGEIFDEEMAQPAHLKRSVEELGEDFKQ